MNIFEIENPTNLELSPIKLGCYTPLDSQANRNFISVHESLETYSEIRKNIFYLCHHLSVCPSPPPIPPAPIKICGSSSKMSY